MFNNLIFFKLILFNQAVPELSVLYYGVTFRPADIRMSQELREGGRIQIYAPQFPGIYHAILQENPESQRIHAVYFP